MIVLGIYMDNYTVFCSKNNFRGFFNIRINIIRIQFFLTDNFANTIKAVGLNNILLSAALIQTYQTTSFC